MINVKNYAHKCNISTVTIMKNSCSVSSEYRPYLFSETQILSKSGTSWNSRSTVNDPNNIGFGSTIIVLLF